MEKNEEKLEKMQVWAFWPARARAHSSWPRTHHGRARSNWLRARERAHSSQARRLFLAYAALTRVRERARTQQLAARARGRVRGMLGQENKIIWH